MSPKFSINVLMRKPLCEGGHKDSYFCLIIIYKLLCSILQFKRCVLDFLLIKDSADLSFCSWFILKYWHLCFPFFFLTQTDNKGRNFLHTAITNGDIESVLFLISVHANVNSRVQDAHQHTPLHLAVLALSEIIVRNLVSVTQWC